MSDLTGFLLARIAEDEQSNNRYEPHTPPRWNPVRVLAECEAKRRIIDSVHVEDPTFANMTRQTCTNPYVLELLALPYADHPDYQQEWRP